ncbi:MAG: helix-turn-helix transcriptional regulator [Bacillota bacterium]|nr:helix-turn-helix transcriptional regulator [Bacillota bacterium]
MLWFKPTKSKLAKFLKKHELSQQDVCRDSGVNKATLSRLCSGDSFRPSMDNGQKIIKSLRRLTKKNVDYDDFWSM